MEIHRGLNANLTFENESTVTITRDSDGTTIVDEAETEVLEETNVLKVEGKDLPQVDLLTMTWEDEEGTHRKEVEIVGGFACTVDDIKGKLDMDVKELPTDTEIQEALEQATKDIEDATWDAYRHRYNKERLSGDGSDTLALDHRNIAEIISVEVDGEALTETELEDVAITGIGVERTSGRWPLGQRNITVAYAYGHENFPTATEPVRDLTAFRLTPYPTNWDERATSYMDGEGNRYSLVTEGARGAQFPLPRVNAFVQRYAAAQVA